ncbi:MAG: ImmA/IrrE family metallo-endopeptidase [Nocardiaceae bacterium]|nr:ImmA/IrrE family metallo-endopeptidase [Nocardiaceae bacterium]
MIRAIITGAFAVAILIGGSAASATAVKACPGDELDNCYTRSEMADFARIAVAMVGEFMSTIDPSNQFVPDAVYLIEDQQTVSDGCEGFVRNRMADAMSYFYCSADNGIYLGLSQMWEFYVSFGAAAPVIGLAHEFGHLMQHAAGIAEPDTFDEAIALENQADCVAGAFAAHLRNDGSIDKTEVKNLEKFLRSIGAAERPGRDHGTPAERANAFKKGLRDGLSACNSLANQTPISRDRSKISR